MTQSIVRCWLASFALIGFVCGAHISWGNDTKSDAQVAQDAIVAMKKATNFMRSRVAVHGGYVYSVTLDLKTRRGEGLATSTEIWVQPPGTPKVGSSFVQAFDSTGDSTFFEAASECARALIHGQLESGGWTDRVDFNPNGANTGLYRSGKGKTKGRNYSTLDDDKSQAAIRFLIELDRSGKFQDSAVHESVQFALDALLKAQFTNGGFPQGWSKPVEPVPVVQASFPTYDWRTEGRFKNYWDFATLNDGLAGTVTKTLQLAYETYSDERYRIAMLKFGDFLILAQLPEPQPAWAQQYNHQLQPIWARKFEPPAIVGSESKDAMNTLMYLTEVTGERRFLKPIPAAIAWLKRSQLPDGQMARFYELQTNKPLYFTKDQYELTYDDSNLPTHYSFKGKSNVTQLETRYTSLAKHGPSQKTKANIKSSRKAVERILSEQDSEGRWITDKKGNPIMDIEGREQSELFLESKVFSKNLGLLADFVTAVRNGE